MTVVPISFERARDFVNAHHRHHRVDGRARYRFVVAVQEGGRIVGVAIVGNPIARHFKDGFTLEVNRSCTDGTRNANSMLYGACARASFALGYRRLITYTRQDEGGASLRGAGWRVVAHRDRPRSWAKESKVRVRRDGTEPAARLLWELVP